MTLCKTVGPPTASSTRGVGNKLNDSDDTEIIMAAAEIVVNACDCHPDGGDADRQHAPVGGVHEPDAIVLTVEVAGLVEKVGDDPCDHQNCDCHSVHDVRRRHAPCGPLTMHIQTRPSDYRPTYQQ